MRNAMWFAGLVLSCTCVSAAVAADTIPMRVPMAVGQKIPEGKTRDEVKRELAMWRAAGCMNVPDNQYPQPCPLPDTTRSMADAFHIR